MTWGSTKGKAHQHEQMFQPKPLSTHNRAHNIFKMVQAIKTKKKKNAHTNTIRRNDQEK